MTEKTPDAPSDNPWRGRLGILVLSHVVGSVSIVSVLAMAPVMSRELSLSATEFGLFVTAYYAAQAVCSIPAGGLVDRHGVGWALVVSHVIMIAGALVLSQAVDLTSGLVALAIMGVGYSLTNPATARGVFEWFPRRRRATAMGIKQVGVPLGGVLGAANGAIAVAVPWQDIMIGIAVVIGLSGLLCLRLIRIAHRRPGEPAHRPLANLREVIGDWNINRFAIISGLYNVGQTNFFAFLALFMREAAQASQPMAGLCVGIAQAASAVGRIGWGVVSDSFFGGRRKALVVGLGATAAVFLAAMALIGPGWGIYLGLGLSLLLGLTVASSAPLVQTLAVETTEPRLAASSMGYNLVGVQIGGMIGPPIFGAMVDMTGGYGSGWLVSAGLVLVGVVMFAAWFKERT